MAPKLKPDAIGVAEMKRYLETESDFDFELRVPHKLREFNLACEHGGHYEDPVTKKSREFDIRIRVKEKGMLNLFASLECKNLRPNFPLLVSCVPRTKEEAWHMISLRGRGVVIVRPRAPDHWRRLPVSRWRVGGKKYCAGRRKLPGRGDERRRRGL